MTKYPKRELENFTENLFLRACTVRWSEKEASKTDTLSPSLFLSLSLCLCLCLSLFVCLYFAASRTWARVSGAARSTTTTSRRMALFDHFPPGRVAANRVASDLDGRMFVAIVAAGRKTPK